MSHKSNKIRATILASVLAALFIGVYFEEQSRIQKQKAALQEKIDLRNKIEKDKEEEHALLIRLARLKNLPTCHHAVDMVNKELGRIYTNLDYIRSRRNEFNRSSGEQSIVGYTLAEIEQEELQRYNAAKLKGEKINHDLISKREEE